MTTVAYIEDRSWKVIIKNSDGTTNDILLLPIPSKDSEKTGEKEPPKETPGLRMLITSQHFVTALTSLAILVVMINTLVGFRSTQNVKGAWPSEPILSPTFFMLSMAAVTFIADVLTFGARCGGASCAKKVSTIVARIRSTTSVMQILVSGAGAGIFKYANVVGNNKDLWGWSCSNAADAMQSVNHSGMLCKTNTGSWILSVLQTGLHILGLLIPLIALSLGKGKDSKGTIQEATKLLKETETLTTKLEGFGR